MANARLNGPALAYIHKHKKLTAVLFSRDGMPLATDGLPLLSVLEETTAGQKTLTFLTVKGEVYYS